MARSTLSRSSLITATAFTGILLFLAVAVYYSAQGVSPVINQLERATDIRLKKSLLVNRMVMAGNRRALLLSKISHVQDPFERDQLLMQVFEHGADFLEARSELVKLPLDQSEQQLLSDQAVVMSKLTAKVNQVIALIEEERLVEAQSLLMEQVVQRQGVMLGSLSQLGRYQQVMQYRDISEIRNSAELHKEKITDSGLAVMLVVVLIAAGVLRALSLGERERRLAHQRLEESHKKLSQSLLELGESNQINSDRQYALDQSALVLMTGVDGKISYVNDKYCEVSGYPRGELLGWTPRIFNSGQHPDSFWEQFWKQIMSGEVVQREICNRNHEGEEFWISSTVTPLMEAGTPRGFLVIAFDVTDRKWMEDELQQSHDAWRRELEKRHSEISQMAFLASHDTLTQLPNQELLLDRLSHAIKRSEDDPEHVGFALHQLDLMNFRVVNEGMGTAVGDQLLIHVAARIKKMLPASATVARMSGKKFAIFREEGGESAEESSELIQQILTRLQMPFQVGGHTIHLEIAMGIALYPDDGDHADLLMSHASAALHLAKEQEQRYVYYKQELNELAQRHALLMHDLRRAVQQGEFELYYQPKSSLQDDRIQGAEALIRWQHPERGLLAPVEFVSLLESSGLIQTLGRWILQQACMQAKQWMDSGVSASDSFHIAVNISVDQLQSYQIVETVKQALDQSGLPPHCLELEITESHYMDQLELSLQHLVALREIGVQVAIDDFGTGHSSLAYLLHLPIDILKIDKCFIDHIPDNPQDLFLAETILSIGERLKLKVVAEGVEHEKQLQWLKQVGCDQVQGYLFSRPLSVTEFEQWVIEHQENLK